MMEFFGERPFDLGDYGRACLQVLRQAYHDLESKSEQVKRDAIEFFEDPDETDPFSYKSIIEYFKELGYAKPRESKHPLPVKEMVRSDEGSNPFRETLVVYPYNEVGQLGFHFALVFDPKPYRSVAERLAAWGHLVESVEPDGEKGLQEAA